MDSHQGGPGEDDQAENKPWSFSRSATIARRNTDQYEQKTLWSDDEDTPLALDHDWRLCETKRAFRKFISRFGPIVENVKQILRDNYRLICDIFRFYSSIEPVTTKWTMSRNEYTDFTLDSSIRDNSPDSGVGEGQLDMLYQQVAIPLEKPTEEQQVFLQEANKIFSRRRGHALMRYEFCEVILRIAQHKFLNNKTASNMEVALKMLLEKNLMRLYNSEVAINRRAFRDLRLQSSEEVDEAFRSNLLFLKRLFQTFAGKSRNAEEYGGLEGKRMVPREWIRLLNEVGAFSPYFTIRDSLLCFKLSSNDVLDEIKKLEVERQSQFPLLSRSYCPHCRHNFDPNR